MTIRLIDPPLHEFLPEGNIDDIVKELTAETGITTEEVLLKIEKLSEVNPMLGLRGCRFIIRPIKSISYCIVFNIREKKIFAFVNVLGQAWHILS